MSKKLTIKDIAKHAGVGTTTVSRVLNDHPYVSDDKRQKVLASIEELNYRPSHSARQLRSNESGLVGFLTNEVATTPYAVDIIRGAQDAASEQDNVLLVLNPDSSAPAMEMAINFLLERQVRGIIFAAFFHRAVQLPQNIYQVPTVMANCYVPDRSLPSAVPDEFTGGYHATRMLLEAGHRRIAFLNVTAPAVDAAQGRLAGYKQALAEFDVLFDAELVVGANDDPQVNYDNTLRFLQMANPATGFFFGNDRTAMGGYSAIRDAGLRIPDDVGIVGFDNQRDIASNLLPPLTTLQLPHYEMGYWACKYLFEPEGDNSPTQKVIDCPVIMRKSVQ
jgi:LacI family transcriptional regulator